MKNEDNVWEFTDVDEAQQIKKFMILEKNHNIPLRAGDIVVKVNGEDPPDNTTTNVLLNSILYSLSMVQTTQLRVLRPYNPLQALSNAILKCQQGYINLIPIRPIKISERLCKISIIPTLPLLIYKHSRAPLQIHKGRIVSMNRLLRRIVSMNRLQHWHHKQLAWGLNGAYWIGSGGGTRTIKSKTRPSHRALWGCTGTITTNDWDYEYGTDWDYEYRTDWEYKYGTGYREYEHCEYEYGEYEYWENKYDEHKHWEYKYREYKYWENKYDCYGNTRSGSWWWW